MKSPTQKANFNLLYSNFKRVEDFDSSSPSKNQKKTRKNHKSANNKKRRTSKDNFEIHSAKDKFDELPLEEQVAEMLKPIEDYDIIEGKSDLNDSSNLYQRDSVNLDLGSNRSKLDHTALQGYTIEMSADNSNTEVKSPQDAKYSINLPPINGHDPFTSNKVVKHWHYHQPVKYNSVNSRVNSVNASSITDTQRKYSGDRFNNGDSLLSSGKYIKIRSNIKPLNNTEFSPASKRDGSINQYVLPSASQSAKNSRINYINMTHKEKPANNLITVNKDGRVSELLTEMNKPISTDNIISSKNVNRLQNASNEAAHLLHGSLNSEKLDKLSRNLLEVNQAKSQRLLADTNTNRVQTTNMTDDEFRDVNNSGLYDSKAVLNSDFDEIRRFSPRMNLKNPEKRKKVEYYNKWYMPVQTWNVTKASNTTSKKYEQLKNDINFYYYNIHDYNCQNQGNPLLGKGPKSYQQMNYESLQDKMKQNMVIKKYKKQLAENNVRLPAFLKRIDE